MKRLIKYGAVIFALMLATSIIGGCLMAGINIVQRMVERTGGSDRLHSEVIITTDAEDGGIYLFGYRIGNVETKTGTVTDINAEEVDSIYVESLAGKLTVESGSEFLVTFKNVPEDYVFEVDGNTLNIKREREAFTIFSSVFQDTPEIMITVPEGKILKEFYVDKGSGSAMISNISAERTTFDTGSGSLTAKQSFLGETEVDSGSGFLLFDDVTAENLVVNSGSGRIDYEGVLTGNCVFDTGSGSVNLDIYGREEDYNIRADMGSGGLYVGGKRAEEDIEYDNADNFLIFDTGSGRVSVKYHTAP